MNYQAGARPPRGRRLMEDGLPPFSTTDTGITSLRSLEAVIMTDGGTTHRAARTVPYIGQGVVATTLRGLS